MLIRWQKDNEALLRPFEAVGVFHAKLEAR